MNFHEVGVIELWRWDLAVLNRVKTMTGREGNGAGLMSQAFSMDHPRLVLADLSTKAGRDVQDGYRFLFIGAAEGIRSPDAHEQFRTLGPEEGMEELAFASMLMRRLDEAKKPDP